MIKFLFTYVAFFGLVAIFFVGCGKKEPEFSPPSVNVTQNENAEKLTYIKVYYRDHEITAPGSVKVTFHTKKDIKNYIEQLEFAIVKLKEAEEKMEN